MLDFSYKDLGNQACLSLSKEGEGNFIKIHVKNYELFS